jgi:hypothetical protein
VVGQLREYLSVVGEVCDFTLRQCTVVDADVVLLTIPIKTTWRTIETSND